MHQPSRSFLALAVAAVGIVALFASTRYQRPFSSYDLLRGTDPADDGRRQLAAPSFELAKLSDPKSVSLRSDATLDAAAQPCFYLQGNCGFKHISHHRGIWSHWRAYGMSFSVLQVEGVVPVTIKHCTAN